MEPETLTWIARQSTMLTMALIRLSRNPAVRELMADEDPTGLAMADSILDEVEKSLNVPGYFDRRYRESHEERP